MSKTDASHVRAKSRSAADALKFLPMDLLSVLASLYRIPRPVANATIQLLPFGSRTALEALDPPAVIATSVDKDAHHRAISLTDFGLEVIEAAYEEVEDSPDTPDRTAQADEIARIIESRRSA